MEVKYRTSASVPDRVTRLAHAPKTTIKLDKIYEAIALRQ